MIWQDPICAGVHDTGLDLSGRERPCVTSKIWRLPISEYTNLHPVSRRFQDIAEYTGQVLLSTGHASR